ncbi:MAG TPA: EamA family transporter [Burkholderiales bacterium]
MSRPAGWKLKAAAAFAAVYVVWGSTYLAIRIGVQKLPPALFAGSRFLAAGVLLAAYARFIGQPWPRGGREWRIIAVVGVLLLIGGNGLVVVGSQWIPSNLVALIVATAALWLAGFGTLGPQGEPLSRQALVGLLLGFGGVALLLRPAATLSTEFIWGQAAVLGAAVLWAAGSIYGKRQRPATPPLMSAAMQSLVAGSLLLLAGFAIGEAAAWEWSWGAGATLGYLIVFGSGAFAAYVWLVHQVSPAALGTYAYVNPAIAVVLGWWLLDERLDDLQLLGMATVLAGVVLVSTAPARVPAPSAQPR